MNAFYNENDPSAAQWLRNLIARGLIAPGAVDARSILEVPSVDLRGDRQSHFFAGIGAWSYAFRLAGIPDDWPIWTGSCPCQPFSTAGLQRGIEDERHLWPVWFERIRECLPSIVFGEQVAKVNGRDWLATVRADLESLGYVVGGADLCAASIGAPHIRQRIYFGALRLADTDAIGRIEQWRSGLSYGDTQPRHDTDGCGSSMRRMGNPDDSGSQRHARHGYDRDQPRWLRAEQSGGQ
jgi:DNA (cytosine-5)-methyltransferase 1